LRWEERRWAFTGRLVGTGDAKLKTPDASAGKNNENLWTTNNPPPDRQAGRSQANQSSKTTASNALVRSSTPLLLVVASAALCSFSSLYFLPSASMTSF
jgi:hypothetical protein